MPTGATVSPEAGIKPAKLLAHKIIADLTSIRALLGPVAPDFADTDLSYLPSSGTDNIMIRLGKTHILRMPRIAGMAAAPGNLLFQGELSALIDWSAAGLADTATDLRIS